MEIVLRGVKTERQKKNIKYTKHKQKLSQERSKNVKKKNFSMLFFFWLVVDVVSAICLKNLENKKKTFLLVLSFDEVSFIYFLAFSIFFMFKYYMSPYQKIYSNFTCEGYNMRRKGNFFCKTKNKTPPFMCVYFICHHGRRRSGVEYSVGCIYTTWFQHYIIFLIRNFCHIHGAKNQQKIYKRIDHTQQRIYTHPQTNN